MHSHSHTPTRRSITQRMSAWLDTLAHIHNPLPLPRRPGTSSGQVLPSPPPPPPTPTKRSQLSSFSTPALVPGFSGGAPPPTPPQSEEEEEEEEDVEGREDRRERQAAVQFGGELVQRARGAGESGLWTPPESVCDADHKALVVAAAPVVVHYPTAAPTLRLRLRHSMPSPSASPEPAPEPPALEIQRSAMVRSPHTRRYRRRSPHVRGRPRQPSERESREFTKMNTMQVQRRLAEVEAARRWRVSAWFFEGVRSAEGLDRLLMSGEGEGEGEGSSASGGEEGTSEEGGSGGESCGSGGTVRTVVLRPEGRGRRRLDIETAFSSLGGFGSGGIWRKIAVLLDPWDIARLARVSTRVKRLVEPLLYEHITLRPHHPHGFSYNYLCHLLCSLSLPRNRPKLQKWARSFRLEAGWEENQIALLDNGASLMDDEIVDEQTGRVLVGREAMRMLVEEEGLLGDGGVKEVNSYMCDILERMPGLVEFAWESAIPLRGLLLSTLAAATPKVSTLTLNLSQPMRKERCWDDAGASFLQWAHVSKYRPAISTLRTLPLASLTLRNLPTRGGDWWKQVYTLIACTSPTLRSLQLLMPPITHTRYPDLFDRYHRIYHLPAHDDDERHLKTPPVFDYDALTAASAAAPAAAAEKLHLHTLSLTGFVLDDRILTHSLAPETLQHLHLTACVEKAGFRLPRDCWSTLTSFRSTGLCFIERVVESLAATPLLPPQLRNKELALPTSDSDLTHRHGEADALETLRRVVLGALPAAAGNVAVLVLKEQWELGERELGAVFSAPGALVEVAVAVQEGVAAWEAFLRGVAGCARLRRVHVLNGFSGGAGGGGRRVVEMARDLERVLVERGGALEGVVVAVRRAAWRMRWGVDGWGLVRVQGALGEVVVGRGREW